MGQNFESTISMKAVGAQEVQAQADAIRKLSESIEGLTTKANKVNEHPGFSNFAEKVKHGIEDPLGAAGEGAKALLEKMGPLGTGITVAAGTFAVLGKVAFEAAHALGEYGTQTQNLALRTGLSTKEVGQFSFAAKVAGQDVSVFESAMRKLSQGLDDNTSEGAKARKGLADLGVVTRDATGTLRPMSSIFLQISEGLNAIQDPAKRNAEALRLFGRAGIELIPTMLGLTENVKRAKEIGLGATDEDLKRWEQYHRNVVEAEALWARFSRKIKEPLAALVTIAFSDSRGHQYTLDELKERGVNLGAFAPRTQRGDDEAARRAGFPRPAYEARNRADQTLDYVGRLQDRQRTDSAIERLFAGGSLAEQLKSAETAFDALARPTKGSSSMEDVSAYDAARRKVEVLKAQVEATKELEAAMKSLAAWEGQMAQKEMDPVSKIFFERDQHANATQQYGRATDAALPAALAALQKLRAEDDKRTFEMSNKAAKTAADNWDGVYKTLEKVSGQNAKEFLDWAKAAKQVADEINNIEVSSERSDIMSRSGKTLAMANLAFGPGQEGSAIAAAYAERKRLAGELFDFEDGHAKTYVEQVRAEKDYRRAMNDAEIEHELKLAELQRKRIEEFRSEMGSLFDALLGGRSGIQQFAVNQLKTLGRAAFSNTATSIVTGGKITAASTFGGTWLGDVFGSKDPSVKLNTAGTHLSMAAAELTQSARALAMSASGGAGGFSPTASTFARIAGSKDFTAAVLNDLPLTHDHGYGGIYSPGIAMPAGKPSANFNFARAAGIGAAGLGAGFGIYSGIEMGGGRGAFTATGSALAGAGAIISLASTKLAAVAGPAGALAGLVLGSILPSLIPDPKAMRAKELEQQRAARAYSEPTGRDYAVDIYGRSFDYDSRGSMRPIIYNDNRQYSAIDAPSFIEWGKNNPGAIAAVTSHAIRNDGGEIAATLDQILP